ncbi:hypothetical protein HDG33_002028 [Paraburkholderia sp. Cpub6]|nr:hypothetical protein [Paraburkholderia sp. Cpub6]
MAIAPAVDDVLAPWQRRSRVAAALTISFGSVFVLVSWLLAFALRDKQRAQAALLRLAATDPLTGLSNRPVLDKRLDDEWKRARRENKPLSVLFIDIDHFKRFNDTYGHESGDEVLVAVADCIASVARRSADLVAALRRRRVRGGAAGYDRAGRVRGRGADSSQGGKPGHRARTRCAAGGDGERRLRNGAAERHGCRERTRADGGR